MIWRLENYELDTEAFELRRRGRPVVVQPKVLEVLIYLVAHRERVVTKQELLDHVWQGIAVGDAALARAIREVRKALGDDGESARTVKTIHGRGYRFVAEVAASPAAKNEREEATSARPSAAPPREGVEGDDIIGRADALQSFDTLLEAAQGASGQLFLISGEPGIGKTRLLEACFARASQRGAVVLAGRCHDNAGAPAFWPWVQILRAFFDRFEPELLAPRHAAALAEVASIMPELYGRVPDLPPAAPLDTPERRFRLFDAVARLLSHGAKESPIVLAVDDLQWADHGSLLLGELLSKELKRARVVLVYAYRDQRGGDELLERMLGSLLREGPFVCRLDGLSREHIAELVARRRLSPSDPETIAELARRTGGNPLFLTQLLGGARRGEAKGRDIDRAASRIPSEVREAISRHLDTLSEACRRVLAAAAVAGPEFTVQTLAAAVESGSDDLAGLIDEARDSGIIREVPRSLFRYEFVHSLIRDALYERLDRAERSRIHGAIADALLNERGATGEHLEEVAHHLLRSRSRHVDEVVSLTVRAAERSFRAGAFDKAATLYSGALEMMAQAGKGPAERRDLMLRLGSALGRDGRLVEAAQAFRAAAAIARPRGDAEPTSKRIQLDAAALRESFHLVAERGPALTARFYEVLFSRFPEARSLFVRNRPREQEKMLYDALTAIVDRAENVPWLRGYLHALGARHAAYGVTEEMHGWVGASLLQTLAEAAGPQWSRRFEKAWIDGYAAISAMMIEGAREKEGGGRHDQGVAPAAGT